METERSDMRCRGANSFDWRDSICETPIEDLEILPSIGSFGFSLDLTYPIDLNSLQ
jgi:hypothetical protein